MSRLAPVLLVVVVLLALATPAAAMGPLEFNVLAGVDFGGTLSSGPDFDTKTGYSLGLEVIFDFPLIDIGAGLEYGFDRDVDFDTVSESINYSRVYAVGRVTLFPMVYLVGRYGYGQLDGIDNLDGGQSWAAGLGLNLLSKIRIEALYNKAKGEVDSQDLDYEYWGARLVYSF